MDIPVVIPTELPAGAHLDPEDPVSVGRSGERRTAGLHLVFGIKKHLYIAYGVVGWDGCGPIDPKVVTIGNQRGLMKTYPPHIWSQVVWPATPSHVRGAYGIYGSVTGAHILRMARSMERARVELLRRLGHHNC